MRASDTGGHGRVSMMAADERPNSFAAAQQLAVPGALPPQFDHDRHVPAAARESVWTRWRGPLLHLVLIGVLLAIWWLIAYLQVWPRPTPMPASARTRAARPANRR